MAIQSGIRTPGTYVDYNTRTARVGLPTNSQKILFLTTDQALLSQPVPVSLYDKTTAKTLFGDDSNAAKMITAALTVATYVKVEVLGKQVAA